MKIRLTVADERGRRDFTVDAEPDAPVAEVLEAVGADPSVPAYLGADPLDPAAPIGRSGIHDGAVVHRGGPGASVRDLASSGVEVRVVGGPSAGLVFRIGPGRHVIGRQHGCAITLDDHECSREHAAIELSTGGELTVEDLGSTNGTRIEGADVTDGGVTLRLGEYVEVGRSFLSVMAVDKPDQTLVPDGEGGFVFNRRYRIRQNPQDVDVEFPRKPTEGDKPSFPWIMAIAPLAVAGIMAVVTGQPTFLLLAVMSPVMTVGSTMNDRRNRKRRGAKDQADYQKALDEAEAKRDAAITSERDQLRQAAPDPALALLTAVGPRDRLWERRPNDADHLNLRVGLGSDLSHRVNTKESDDEPEIWGVPVIIPLPTIGVLGIAAPFEQATGMARWMALQAATFHRPDDLRIVLLTDADRESSWKWIEWLPHAQIDPARGVVAVGNSPDTVARRVKELQGLLTIAAPALRRPCGVHDRGCHPRCPGGDRRCQPDAQHSRHAPAPPARAGRGHLLHLCRCEPPAPARGVRWRDRLGSRRSKCRGRTARGTATPRGRGGRGVRGTRRGRRPCPVPDPPDRR